MARFVRLTSPKGDWIINAEQVAWLQLPSSGAGDASKLKFVGDDQPHHLPPDIAEQVVTALNPTPLVRPSARGASNG